LLLDGEDVVPAVHDVLQRMRVFTDKVRSGQWLGYTGSPSAVVNLGIGGSDLGPLVVQEALSAYAHPDLTVHLFPMLMVSTLPAPCSGWTRPPPVRDCVQIFTTPETLLNAEAAKAWFCALASQADVARHLLRFPPMRARCRPSALIPSTCSASGIGWAGVIRYGRPSVCR
jgi:glucose-6-phosphate isomerase